MVELKITILKKMSTQDVFGREKTEEMGIEPDNICPVLEKGAVFTSMDGKFPEGFCAWMWHDIFPEIVTLRMEGDFPWMKEKGTMIASCSDGIRPVIARLERIQE